MCCRENSGGRWLYGSVATQTLSVMLLVALVFIAQACSRKQSPWFGRDKNLPHAPISVVTGSVDWQQGVLGVLELQMPKAEVEKRLGEPLVSAIPFEQALQEGLDPEDVNNFFYAGVFAWVDYDASGKVLSIKFDLKNTEERMEMKQSLLLVADDKSLLLSRRTTRETLKDFLKAARQGVVEEQPYALVVRFKNGRVFSANFDAQQRLETVGITR